MGDETMAPAAGTGLLRVIRMVRRLNAPPERVWRAWAHPEELARWLPERVEGALAVGARTVLVWSDRRVWWDVMEAQAGRSFAFQRPWLPDERFVTTVRITFEPAGYGTLMTLGDGPFPLDRPGGVDAWAEGLQGWSEALAMLRAHLDFSVDLRTRP
jgi:uncharacterized protein YndB with AHSA1/START domain